MIKLMQIFSPNKSQQHVYDRSIREKELAKRLRWLLNLRWVWAGCCLLIVLAATLPISPPGINYRLLLLIAAFLIISNIVYLYLTRHHTSRDILNMHWINGLVIAQTLTDYLALALTSYTLGGIETPAIILFLAPVSLVTLFFRRRVSLFLTCIAVLFAVTPMLFEFYGIIPTNSIFGHPFKQDLSSNPYFLSSYTIGVTIIFLFFWYIVSEIANSLHQQEERLDSTCIKLKQMDRERTQAMLHTAHELKAPLGAIKSFVYTLSEGYCGELPEKAARVIKRIGVRSDMLMDQVVDIIHLSNLRTLVQPELQLEQLDLTALVAHQIDAARELAVQRGITIHNLSENMERLLICGSEEYLHTLFSNLLQNAVNYSHDGGNIELDIISHSDRLTVQVRDQGIGISKENQEKIFDEYFRTNAAVEHYPNGTGLGLPMVREIAKIHHAILRVQSKPGEGSQFSITFYRPKKGLE